MRVAQSRCGRHPGRDVTPAEPHPFRSGYLALVDLTAEDLGRAAELVMLYADFPLGTTDATIIAVAERLEITTIATLDARHFAAVRPRHVREFTLVP